MPLHSSCFFCLNVNFKLPFEESLIVFFFIHNSFVALLHYIIAENFKIISSQNSWNAIVACFIYAEPRIV